MCLSFKSERRQKRSRPSNRAFLNITESLRVSYVFAPATHVSLLICRGGKNTRRSAFGMGAGALHCSPYMVAFRGRCTKRRSVQRPLCSRGTAQKEEACGLSLDGPPALRFACQGTVGPRTSDSFNKTSRCFANRRSAKQPVFLKQSENLAHEPYDKPGIRFLF